MCADDIHNLPDEDFDESESSHCIVCGQELGIPGGMEGTGMCGPCCSGESETASEFGNTW